MELSLRVKLEFQWKWRKKFVKNSRLLSTNGSESNTRLLSQTTEYPTGNSDVLTGIRKGTSWYLMSRAH